MTTTTTRRTLLKGVPAVAIAATIPATASALPVDRTAWNSAMAVLAKIEAEDAAFTPGWFKTWERCKAECEALPHTAFEPEAYSGGRCQTTADSFAVKQARREVADLDEGRMQLDDLPGLRQHYEIKRKLVETADERDRKVQSVRDRYDMDRLDEKAERFGDQIAEARTRLMDTPAPDLAALHWKLLQLRDEDGDMNAWSAKHVEQTFADIARLLPQEA